MTTSSTGSGGPAGAAGAAAAAAAPPLLMEAFESLRDDFPLELFESFAAGAAAGVAPGAAGAAAGASAGASAGAAAFCKQNQTDQYKTHKNFRPKKTR